MHTVTAKITFEIEVTVEAGVDQFGFDVVSIAAVSGYNRDTKTWTMTPAFKPEELAKLVEDHFAREAQGAIDEEAAEEHAAYVEGRADAAYEASL